MPRESYRGADQEPMLQVQIENRGTPMMIDTGATYTCVSPNYASHLPMSGKYAKTGNTQLIPMTAPVRLIADGKSATIPILVSDQTPINLLGRDALCKMGIQIQCSPDGVIIDKIGLQLPMINKQGTANVYWLGGIEVDVDKTVRRWGRFIQAQIPKAVRVKSEYHCTMQFDPNQDPVLDKLWAMEANGRKAPITSQIIIIGRQGAAMDVNDRDGSEFVNKWFNVSDSVPHITLLVNEGFTSKDLGPMMRRARRKRWERTDNPLIFHSTDKNVIKIITTTEMIGEPREVEVNVSQQAMLGEGIGVIGELREEMEKIIPSEVWSSQHDTDVGLVKSASPVYIKVKPDAKPPWKAQYHMKPEAEEGISATIEGLIRAGVLIEIQSCCNTPLLPVLKADGKKWRLVHDLRAVNDIVQDCPAEVPNPHTLLTNVPPDAKYFTVIDLCGAFFSVPLAEECRHLFAFRYRGKTLSYTRLPQGFSQSPHLFNQILKADLEELMLDGTLIQYVDDLL
uniref:ribonuclease H n=1 Tax=Hucho hucho TaxID=62062 RepID=A0A4W5Q3E0_9TELE